jgi:hypothetical protein
MNLIVGSFLRALVSHNPSLLAPQEPALL